MFNPQNFRTARNFAYIIIASWHVTISHKMFLWPLNTLLNYTEHLRMSIHIDPSIGFTPEPMRWRKATKQLATLGPASSTFEMIEKLFLAGKTEHLLSVDLWRHPLTWTSTLWFLSPQSRSYISSIVFDTHHIWKLQTASVIDNPLTSTSNP